MELCKTNLEEQAVTVWKYFIKANSRILRNLSQDMQENHNIPLSWYDVLVKLYQSPQKGLTMQALANEVILSPSGLTRLVDRMMKAGLVERHACKNDRRVCYAMITPDGETLLKKIQPTHQMAVKRCFTNHLTEEELTVMEPALKNLIQINS